MTYTCSCRPNFFDYRQTSINLGEHSPEPSFLLEHMTTSTLCTLELTITTTTPKKKRGTHQQLQRLPPVQPHPPAHHPFPLKHDPSPGIVHLQPPLRLDELHIPARPGLLRRMRQRRPRATVERDVRQRSRVCNPQLPADLLHEQVVLPVGGVRLVPGAAAPGGRARQWRRRRVGVYRLWGRRVQRAASGKGRGGEL